MDSQSVATRARDAKHAVAAAASALLLLLGACSQSAGPGAGTRLGAAELGSVDGRAVTSRARASNAPALELLDRHESAAFNRSAAEIVDYHAPTRRVFVVDSGAAQVRVLGLGPSGFRGAERVLEPVLDMSRSQAADAHGFEAHEVTSLAVGGNVLAVAVPATRNDRRGRVAFYSADTLGFVGSVPVGFGPDMLTFTPDGRRVLVANEGEQVRGPEQRIISDPEGSVSIIDLVAGVSRPQVSHARFERFDARVEEYRAAGVRISRLGDRFFESGDGSVRLSRDLEPEYIAVAPDGRSAWVSLQENDAVALLDIDGASFVDILPLGAKDFSLGQPTIEPLPLGAQGAECQTARAGLVTSASAPLAAEPATGLWMDPENAAGEPDVAYVLRDATIERHVLEPGGTRCSSRTVLEARDGARPAFRGLGRDSRDGTFWLGDAARPVLYRADADGRIIGELALPGPTKGRVAALAFDPALRRLFVFLDAPAAPAEASHWVHVLVLDGDPRSASFGARLAEHLYLPGDAPGRAGARALAASVVDRGRLLLVERSADAEGDVVYRIDLTGAGDLRAFERDGARLPDDALRELLDTHALAPVHRRSLFGLANTAAGIASTQAGRVLVLGNAGLELLPGRPRAGHEPAPSPILAVVKFDVGGGLDASDRDGAVRLGRWPVLGEYMPDGIAAVRLGGQPYFLTANEGDTRGYDAKRLRDLELDPSRFPDASALQASASLGRLKVSALDGDLDGDGDLDEVHAFGARSLSLWDRHGRLVFDTGSLFEDVTAAALAGAFNSNNLDNGSFDSRSDDRGPEPEGLTVAEIDGHAYAFVGLERVGGIVVLDVTDPSNVRFVEYDNPRDFSANTERGGARDLGPEGLKFVPAASSPTGRGLLLVANEVSGTTAAYDVNL